MLQILKLLSILKIVYFAFDFDTSAWPLATFGFQVVYFSLSVSVTLTRDFYHVSSIDPHLELQAIYPTVVIVLVESQRSMADICEISPSIANRIAGQATSETRQATLGHLSFTASQSMVRWVTNLNLSAHAYYRPKMGRNMAWRASFSR